MSFLDTSPAPLQRAEIAAHWGRFRIADPRQRERVLREICHGDVPLMLAGPGMQRAASATLWAVDANAGRLSLNLTDSTMAPEVLHAPELWAAAYLREVKVQFEVRGLVPGTGTSRALHADWPSQVLQLPRRHSVRVRRPDRQTPLLRFAHPEAPDYALMMPALDISVGGCALLQLRSTLPLLPGERVTDASIDLDAQTVLKAGFSVRHIAAADDGQRAGWRLGCEWHGMSSADAEVLQRWIARGRRRRGLISLSLD